MGHLAYFFQRRNTVLVIQISAVLLLISTALTWVSVTPAGAQVVNLSGEQMAPVARMVGLLAVVAGVLISLFRGWIRGILGAVLLGGGLIAVIAVVLTLLDPSAAAGPALQRLGIESDAQHSTGGGLWLGFAGSLGLIIGSLAVLLFSKSWDDESTPGPSSGSRRKSD